MIAATAVPALGIRRPENAGFEREQPEALPESFAADPDGLATRADVAADQADVCRAMPVQTVGVGGMRVAALTLFGQGRCRGPTRQLQLLVPQDRRCNVTTQV